MIITQVKYYLEERSLVTKDALCPKSLINCKSSSSIISKGRASSSSSSFLSILLTVTQKKNQSGAVGRDGPNNVYTYE
jgi:hypothetical protein